MNFTKMHGLGNDYLYHFGELENAEELAIKLSDRHFGIGSDGIITISESEIADFRMRIYNADGSEAMMCGNGIRCVGKYVYDKGYTKQTELTVETKSGVKRLHLEIADQKVVRAKVEMGTAVVEEKKQLEVQGETVVCRPVSMGNPHAVIFVKHGELDKVYTLGKRIENHEEFPGGVNVEFVEVIDTDHLRMRVWERGSGITMACGTGACASTAAAIADGLCRANVPVQVELDGGSLEITIDDRYQVQMIGPAQTICECEVAVG
ncbi:MAG: diaminopimelate epimerase [Eubacteriales bacterium]|nr:diaminopimelate epimerase [Eubacteriales bacterium]